MSFNTYPRGLILRSRTIYYTETPTPDQPIPEPPPERSSEEEDGTYSPTSNSVYSRSLDSLSSEPSLSSSDAESIGSTELAFLGVDQAFVQNITPGRIGLTDDELIGLDAELYRHLAVSVNDLTLPRDQLRQIFDEARWLWGSQTSSPISPASSTQSLPWDDARRREADDLVVASWEHYRPMDEPSLLQAYFPEITDEPQEPTTVPSRETLPWPDVRQCEADERLADAWEQYNRLPDPSMFEESYAGIMYEPLEPPVPWEEINDIDPDYEDDNAVQHQVHMHNRREMIQRARETRARINHEERVRIREDRRARTEGYRRARIKHEERRARTEERKASIRAEEERAKFLEADQRTSQIELAQERGRARSREEEQVDDQAEVAMWGQWDQQTIANRRAALDAQIAALR